MNTKYSETCLRILFFLYYANSLFCRGLLKDIFFFFLNENISPDPSFETLQLNGSINEFTTYVLKRNVENYPELFFLCLFISNSEYELHTCGYMRHTLHLLEMSWRLNGVR